MQTWIKILKRYTHCFNLNICFMEKQKWQRTQEYKNINKYIKNFEQTHKFLELKIFDQIDVNSPSSFLDSGSQEKKMT